MSIMALNVLTFIPQGRVTIWNLEQYAMKLNETSPPPVLLTWEAHLTEITSALAIEGSGQMYD